MKMSKQEIFDIAVEHALKMERKSVDSFTGEDCRYRSEGGRCLVGALISDEEYCREMEGWDASALEHLENLLPVRLTGHGRFLNDLQACHDDTPSGGVFKAKLTKNLKNLARRYGLEFKEDL